MAGAFESNQVGQKQDISDIVANIGATAAPFYSMLKKEQKPQQKKMDYQAEKYPDVSIKGVMDGKDVSSFEHVPRGLLTALQQWFRRPWSVSRFADVTEVAGLPKGEKGKQRAIAATLLKFMIEGRLLSNEECSLDNGTTTANETRGALRWLQNTAQTLYPVPEDYRTPAACIYSGAVASLTESAFRNMMEAAYANRRGESTLDGYVGTDLKAVFDDWSVFSNAGSSFETFPVRQFNLDLKEKSIINIVDFLKFSTGTVRLHLSSFLHLGTDGAPSAYSPKSGVFIDHKMWGMAHLDKPQISDLPDLGGGPRGYADALCGAKCYNPLGQLAVKSNS